MAPPSDPDHDCGWKAYAEELEQRLTALEKAFQRKSERRKESKLPPAVPKKPATLGETKQTRDAMAAMRDAKLETLIEPLSVEPSACTCVDCGSTDLREIGEGKRSTIFEYIPPRFRKRVFLRQTLACPCGKLITAETPARVGLKTRYAPSFVAHLCTSKLADSMPQHRLEKEYKRLGIPVARSTMNALLHRAAAELAPLYAAACALMKNARVVGADETSVRQANLDKRAFMWTFNTPELSVYKYAETRSGTVAVELLGDSAGILVVDQYRLRCLCNRLAFAVHNVFRTGTTSRSGRRKPDEFISGRITVSLRHCKFSLTLGYHRRARNGLGPGTKCRRCCPVLQPGLHSRSSTLHMLSPDERASRGGPGRRMCKRPVWRCVRLCL